MSEERKKKVLMLTSVASMIDQFNIPNIRLLQDMGYEVHAACNFQKGNTCDARQIQRLTYRLLQMHVVQHQWDCPRSICSAFACTTAFIQLYRLLGKEDFAWIHCQSPIGGALARIAAHRKGVPVVYTAHGFHFYQGAPLHNWLLYYPVEKCLAHWTDVLITVNQEDARMARRHLRPRNCFFIPGVGIAVERFQIQQMKDKNRGTIRRMYQIPEDAVLLLSTGELNQGKNHRLVLAAMAALQRQDVYYMVCGQGKLQKKLLRYAYRLGIRDHIRLVGYQEQMPLFYQSADIFVFPSVREGRSVALMEAMAAGLPCVVSDIRGNRELIDDSSLRFSPRCCAQLVRILKRLLEHRQLLQEYGRYNQTKIQGCRLETVEQRMRKIYANMQAGARKPFVSILLAVYRPNLHWLRQLFVSILHQSFSDYDILLMDDGSGQDVFDKIRQLSAEVFGRAKRITLLQSQKNEGSNRTFEKLTLLARSEYLAFCDQDDIWEPDKLKLLVEAIRRQDAVLVYSDMSVIDAEGRKLFRSLHGIRKGLKFVSGEGLTAAYIMDNCTAACSMLVRMDIAKKAVPFYEGVYCDQWIAACAAAHGRIAFVDVPLVRYRRHGENQTETLGGIKNRSDYRNRRILPAVGLVQELQRRKIHYPHETDMQAFVRARMQGNAAGIFRYRRYNRKYAYFDLMMLCLPEQWTKKILRLIQHADRADRGNRKL